MSLESLTSSILFANAVVFVGIGLVVLAGIVVIINNIFHRYWKPITFFQYPSHPDYPMPGQRFINEEEPEHEHSKQPSGSKKDRTRTTGNQQQPDPQ